MYLDQGAKLQPRYVPWLESNLQLFGVWDYAPTELGQGQAGCVSEDSFLKKFMHFCEYYWGLFH